MVQNLPTLIYGVAWMSDEDEMKHIFETLQVHGITNLDTARAYEGSEELIAKADATKHFTITTKAPCGWYAGGGKRQSILDDAAKSLKALGVDKVDVFLLHAPDISVSIQETLDAVQELYKDDKFNKFGLSNFTADQVQEAYDYAKSKGYVLPTVYQANYNLIGRKNETLLFPVLRKLGISIHAYSPIAGGFLVKTPEQITSPEAAGRWDPNSWLGSFFSSIYGGKPSLLTYLREFGELSEKAGLSKVAIAYRWVRYHSELKGDDGLVLGTKSVKQLEETLRELDKGPLEPWIVDRLEEMWKKVENDVPIDNFHATVGAKN